MIACCWRHGRIAERKLDTCSGVRQVSGNNLTHRIHRAFQLFLRDRPNAAVYDELARHNIRLAESRTAILAGIVLDVSAALNRSGIERQMLFAANVLVKFIQNPRRFENRPCACIFVEDSR